MSYEKYQISSSSTTLPSKPRAQLQRHEKITRRPSRRCHPSFLLSENSSNSSKLTFKVSKSNAVTFKVSKSNFQISYLSFISSKNFTSFFIYYGHPRFLINPLPSTNTWRHSTPLTILQLHAASSQGGGCWRTSQGAALTSKFNRETLCYDLNTVQKSSFLFFHSLARVTIPARRSSKTSCDSVPFDDTSLLHHSNSTTSTFLPSPRAKLPREEREPDSPRLKFQLGSYLIYFFSYLTNNTRINLCPLKR